MLIGLFTLVVPTIAMASGTLGTSATVTVPAIRGRAYQPDPLAERRVVFISDSALAGIRWLGALDELTEVIWDHHLESCRRLVFPSCRGRERYTPLTTLNEIELHNDRFGTADPSDVLVIGVGYNDWEERFAGDFDTIIEAARAAGFETIVWLTYRDDTAYRLPSSSEALFANYAEMNTILHDKLATGNYPDVRLWDYRSFTADHPEWFTSDGVHLTATGAHEVARWLSSHFTDNSPPWLGS